MVSRDVLVVEPNEPPWRTAPGKMTVESQNYRVVDPQEAGRVASLSGIRGVVRREGSRNRGDNRSPRDPNQPPLLPRTEAEGSDDVGLTTAPDDEQQRRSRRLLSMKAELSSDRLEIELTAPLDDEEQPARHGSALAAARRRAWSSLANVALLRLSMR